MWKPSTKVYCQLEDPLPMRPKQSAERDAWQLTARENQRRRLLRIMRDGDESLAQAVECTPPSDGPGAPGPA